MAIGASGLYAQNWLDIFDATQTTWQYLADAHRCALITDTHTPAYATDTLWTDIDNEVGASGSYASKGDLLASKTLALNGTTIEWDAADTAYTAATITARGAVILNDALTTPLDGLLCLLYFGGSDVTSTAGTFTVQYATNGFIQIPNV